MTKESRQALSPSLRPAPHAVFFYMTYYSTRPVSSNNRGIRPQHFLKKNVEYVSKLNNTKRPMKSKRANSKTEQTDS